MCWKKIRKIMICNFKYINVKLIESPKKIVENIKET